MAAAPGASPPLPPLGAADGGGAPRFSPRAPAPPGGGGGAPPALGLGEELRWASNPLGPRSAGGGARAHNPRSVWAADRQ